MADKTICLVCVAGMSSSILVSRMQEVAKEKDWDIKIAAVSASEVKGKVKQGGIDVFLFSPQVRHLLPQFEEMTSVPMRLIDKTAYGMLNAEKILTEALA